ncbi:hypothetical protein [Arthrobacter sp. RCC_34]|uniref:hypothetical protein n=1 Tax=Arthrobacter sp. RCC_34 TaxID=3239230 RepID=UPI0035257AD1
MTHRDENSPLRAALNAIDAAHPLVAPMNGNVQLILPRLDRMEAKDAYVIEYLEYLERRIAELESRLSDG